MKLKINILAELDADTKELAEELSVEKGDNLIEAVEAKIKEGLQIGLETGDLEITSITVTQE